MAMNEEIDVAAGEHVTSAIAETVAADETLPFAPFSIRTENIGSIDASRNAHYQALRELVLRTVYPEAGTFTSSPGVRDDRFAAAAAIKTFAILAGNPTLRHKDWHQAATAKAAQLGIEIHPGHGFTLLDPKTIEKAALGTSLYKSTLKRPAISPVLLNFAIKHTS